MNLSIASVNSVLDPLVARVVALSPMWVPVIGFMLATVVPAYVAATALEWLLFRLGLLTPPMMSPRRERFWMRLLVAGIVFRTGTILIWRGPMDLLYSDAGRHWDNAKHFLDPGPQGCSNPYFYQLFLFLVIQVTRNAKLAIHLVNVALSLAYPFFWYRFAGTVMRRRLSALRFAAVLMFLPTHVVMFSFFMNETVLLPLLGAALWTTSVAGRRRSGALFVGAALLWVIAILTRSVVLPVSVVAMGWCIHRMRVPALAAFPVAAVLVGSAIAGAPALAEVIAKRSLSLVVAGIVAAVLVLVVYCLSRPLSRVVPLFAAWTVLISALGIASLHSFKHLKRYTPFGDNSVVVLYFASGAAGYEVDYYGGGHYIFGSPSLYISPFDPFYNWRSSRWKTVCPDAPPWPKACDNKSKKDRDAINTAASIFKFVVDPAKKGADVKETLKEVLKENRAILPRLIFENMLLTSFSHSWPDSGKESGPGVICLWERWIWFPLFLASVSKSLLFMFRRRRLYLVPTLALTMILGLYASQITVMEGRYRKPIEPMAVLSLFWLAG